MSRMLKVTSVIGRSFEVDISDEAFKNFQQEKGGPRFRHGDRIIDKNNGHRGTIIGVAPSEYSEKTLWYALDFDNGLVVFSEPWRKKDLTLIP